MNKMIKRIGHTPPNPFLICLFLMCFALAAFAQQKTITGTVVDTDGLAMPGVNILIKGTNQGTVTNVEGQYKITIDASTQTTLVYSYIGTQTQEILVQAQSVINVTLQDAMWALDEVVVVGYGTQESKDVTGAVSVVGSKELVSRPNTQVGALIQGKAAGVQVLSSSGKPSQGLNLRIRGTNSINAGSEPLYVIDGVPTQDTRSLNPADIESISILKDAASAAIYGSQAANGVVLITTKRGTSDKTKVTLDTYTGFSQVWNTLPVLNGEQYRDLMTELGQNTDWDLYSQRTDWQQEIFQNGFSQNYQLAFSGKSDKTNYYVSGGWVSQEGAIRSAQMNRANFKINLAQEVNEWLSIGTNIAFTKYSDVDVTDNTNVNSGGVLLGALTTPSVIGIYNADGTFTSNPFQNWENPIASTDGTDRAYNSQRFLGNTYFQVKFLKDFSFKSNLGIDFSNGVFESFLDPFRTSYGRALNGRGIHSTDKSTYYIVDNTINYAKELAKHSIQALVGTVVQKYQWENSNIERRNFSSDGISTVNGGSEVTAASASKSEKANSSFISRVNYAFADKYLVTANLRVDGSSIFGPDNRWGYFPSFSFGWRLSEESFMKKMTQVEDVKLRAGWGIVGNDQIANYAYLGRVGSGANYPIGGVASPGTYPASIENRTLRWEESTQANIGLDVVLYQGRVRFTADAYVKNTNDLLLNAPLPKSTGFDNTIQNIGKLQNKGFELSISTVNVDKAIIWNTDLNLSLNRNEVIDLVGQELLMGSIAGRGDASLVKEGLPLGTLYGYIFGGVDPATGNAYYIDQQGESTFAPTPEDRVIIGDANPDFIFGITNNVSYKGLSLMVFLQGVYGNDMLNASRIELEGMTDPKNQSTAVLNRWRESGDITAIPRASWGSTNNSRISSRFIEDASYLRIKAVTLSYQLPKELLGKVHLQAARMYVTGENLLTFTKYSGFDPEVNAFGSSNTVQGIDYGTYPQTRNIIIGLNLTF